MNDSTSFPPICMYHLASLFLLNLIKASFVDRATFATDKKGKLPIIFDRPK
jgi:hypothetical protein